MTATILPFPPWGPRPDLALVEAAWRLAWRTFWVDLPLAWASEMDRSLFRWIEPVVTETGAAGLHPEEGPHTATEAVALSLGCDPSAEIQEPKKSRNRRSQRRAHDPVRGPLTSH